MLPESSKYPGSIEFTSHGVENIMYNLTNLTYIDSSKTILDAGL